MPQSMSILRTVKYMDQNLFLETKIKCPIDEGALIWIRLILTLELLQLRIQLSL